MRDPSSIKYSDLAQILAYFGYVEVSTKGSHVKSKHPQMEYDLVVPVHRNECKAFYKMEARKRIKLLIEN